MGLMVAAGASGCDAGDETVQIPDAAALPDSAWDQAVPDGRSDAVAEEAEACAPATYTCDTLSPLPASPWTSPDGGGPVDAGDDASAPLAAAVAFDPATGSLTITLASHAPAVASASISFTFTTDVTACTGAVLEVPLHVAAGTLTGSFDPGAIVDAGWVAPCGHAVLHLTDACGTKTDVPLVVSSAGDGYIAACATLCGAGSYAASQTEICTTCPPADLQCSDLDPNAGKGAAFTYDTTAHAFTLTLASGAGKAVGGKVTFAYYDGLEYCSKTFELPLTAQDGVLHGTFGGLPSDFVMFEIGYLTGAACRTTISVDLECGASATFETQVTDVTTPDAGAYDVQFDPTPLCSALW